MGPQAGVWLWEGALLARYLAGVTGLVGTDQPEGFVAGAVGAVIVLVLYGAAFRRGRRGGNP